jgi:2-polyprenyl-3-methyl-5-hydroxy-6-metoxy-1,4-benzoquinol methylase
MKKIPSDIQCPDCKSNNCDEFGKIPKTDVFAGRFLDEPLESGSLYRCKKCALGFRWPQLTKEALNTLYQQGDDETWSVATATDRVDWQQAESWLHARLSVGGKVLDVGCFDGEFLSLLGSKYGLFGIEIHKLASLRAEVKGIKIVAPDYENISGTYDCVASFDVIEHVRNPGDFLEACLNSVPTGGYVLISTGNFDAFAFKMQGAAYWYSTISEHVSFISPQWFKLQSNRLNFDIEKIRLFSHSERRGVLVSIKETFLNVLYWLWPPSIGWLRRMGIGQRRFLKHKDLINHPPSWFTAEDHFMVLLKKS